MDAAAAGAESGDLKRKRPRDDSPSSSDSSSDSESSDDEARSSKRRKHKKEKHKKEKKSKKHKKEKKSKKHKKEKKSKKHGKEKKQEKEKEKEKRKSSPVQLSKFLEHAGDGSDDSGDEEARYSVITGKRINLDRKRTGEDRQTDKERKQYLKWLNAGYD